MGTIDACPGADASTRRPTRCTGERPRAPARLPGRRKVVIVAGGLAPGAAAARGRSTLQVRRNNSVAPVNGQVGATIIIYETLALKVVDDRAAGTYRTGRGHPPHARRPEHTAPRHRPSSRRVVGCGADTGAFRCPADARRFLRRPGASGLAESRIAPRYHIEVSGKGLHSSPPTAPPPHDNFPPPPARLPTCFNNPKSSLATGATR